jgi:hypothetical protein
VLEYWSDGVMGKAASKKSFFFPIFHFSLFLPGFRFTWADPEMIIELALCPPLSKGAKVVIYY